MTRVFVVTEVVFAIIFVVLGFTFMQWNGVIGVTQAYALNYIFYMSCMVLIFRKTLYV